MALRTARGVLRICGPALVALVWWGCNGDDPIIPKPPPRITFDPMIVLPGLLPIGDLSEAWSPSGKRLAYRRWNGVNWDHYVYDADRPEDPPALVHSGDWSRETSWAPDSRWLLYATQAPSDSRTDTFSLVAFRVEPNATPHRVLERAAVNRSRWGANGKIYWWNKAGERQSLDPPGEWTTENPGPFPDRTVIVWLDDRERPQGFRFVWFHTSPEEEGGFTFLNPGQLAGEVSPTDVCSGGTRFIADIPTYCGVTGIIDRQGRILQSFWSSGCENPPFAARTMTADGEYVLGFNEKAVGNDLEYSILYIADADASWRVPVQHAPQGWFIACARAGYVLAYQNVARDSIFVGSLDIAPQ